MRFFLVFVLFVLLLFLFSPNNCCQLFYVNSVFQWEASSLMDISLVHSFLIASVFTSVQLQSFSLPVGQYRIMPSTERNRRLENVFDSLLGSEKKDWRTKAISCLQLLVILFFFCFLELMFLNESNNKFLGGNKLTFYMTADYLVKVLVYG